MGGVCTAGRRPAHCAPEPVQRVVAAEAKPVLTGDASGMLRPMSPSVVVLEELAARLVGVRGVHAVALGGSRARGTAGPGSDTDLGLYVDDDLDLDGLRALAVQVGGPAAQLTDRGQWGPVVDGGGWLQVDGSPVDWLYRDVFRVAASDAVAGRVTWIHQTGHPLGVPSVAYAAEVALGVALADPDGLLAGARAAVDPYPAALTEAFVTGLAEADFMLGALAKPAARGDVVYVAGILHRVLGVCAHAVCARAGRWVTNDKGLIAEAARQPGAPPDLLDRAEGVLIGLSPGSLPAAVDRAEELLVQVRAAVARTGTGLR